jgi:hypothetical protein
MENFPSNSHRPKSDENEEKKSVKKVERVIEGGVVRRKKPLGKRFTETFFGGDVEGVIGYVVMDVLIPAAKDALADAFSQGIERMLFGEARPTSRRHGGRPSGSSGYVSYNRYSSGAHPARREESRTVSRRARSRHEFDEIILPGRAAAEEVLERLYELIDRYDEASVADLYTMVDVEANFIDEKWGWTDLQGSRVVRTSNGGYLLSLPKPIALD